MVMDVTLVSRKVVSSSSTWWKRPSPGAWRAASPAAWRRQTSSIAGSEGCARSTAATAPTASAWLIISQPFARPQEQQLRCPVA